MASAPVIAPPPATAPPSNPAPTDTGGYSYNVPIVKDGVTTYKSGPTADIAKEITTLYSGNVQDKHIPDLNGRMDDLTNKGQYTDGQGNLHYADGSLVPAPADAQQSANGNWYSNGQSYGKSGSGAIPGQDGSNDLGIPPAEQALIDQMKASTDSATKASIDAIEQTYNSLISEQRGINAGAQASADTALLRAGSARYSPESAANQSATVASYGLKQVADLEAKEQSAIAAAKAAQQSKNYDLMGKQIDIAENVRKEKQDAAKTLNEKLAENAAQAKNDNAISTLYGQGTTNPADIVTKLSDLGINVTLSDVAAAIKNIIPAGVDDLIKTAQQNGASPSVIKAILASPSLDAAYTAAGKYANGGTGIIGEYNYAKANGYSGTFSQYQNEDANRKASAAGGGTALDALQDQSGVSALGASKSGDILSVAGISLPAFNYLTQGTSALTRMNGADRIKIMAEAQDFLKKKGVDVSTFQSQYKAYNDVLSTNIYRANQTQVMAGEVSGSADALISAIDQKDMPALTSNKTLISVGQDLSLSFNGTVATKYATQLQFMANDLAGYLAAARGAKGGPELTDMQDAAKIINNGMNKGSVQAFKDSINANETKVAGVVQHAVDGARKQVWGLFGVGDKYTPAPVQKTADQITADDKASVSAIATFQSADPGNKALIDKLHDLMPDATASEIAQQLGLTASSTP